MQMFQWTNTLHTVEFAAIYLSNIFQKRNEKNEPFYKAQGMQLKPLVQSWWNYGQVFEFSPPVVTSPE